MSMQVTPKGSVDLSQTLVQEWEWLRSSKLKLKSRKEGSAVDGSILC